MNAPLSRETEFANRHLPGWTVRAHIASEDTGVLVEVERFCTNPSRRGLEIRTVWIDNGGAVDAHIDELGYIVTADHRKL